MDARALDMLHGSRDDDGLAIRDRVDLDLHALEVLVDEDLAARHGADRPGHVAAELVAVAHDLRRATAQDVRRTHKHGVARALSDRLGLVDRRRRAAHGLRHPYRVPRSRESASVFGEVNRLHARAEDGDLVLVERLREIDRGLAAELDERAAGLFRASYMERAVEVERDRKSTRLN